MGIGTIWAGKTPLKNEPSPLPLATLGPRYGGCGGRSETL